MDERNRVCSSQVQCQDIAIFYFYILSNEKSKIVEGTIFIIISYISRIVKGFIKQFYF